jgi:hypothetical protein
VNASLRRTVMASIKATAPMINCSILHLLLKTCQSWTLECLLVDRTARHGWGVFAFLAYLR